MGNRKRLLAGVLAAALVVAGVQVTGAGTMKSQAAGEETVYRYEKVDVNGEQAKANSEQNPAKNADGPASYAFNGVTTNFWHSRYTDWNQVGENETVKTEQDKNKLFTEGGQNLWIAVPLTAPTQLGKVTYQQRQDNNNTSGKGYRLYVANATAGANITEDLSWELVKEGEFPLGKEAYPIVLDEPKTATHFKLEFTSTWDPNKYATAAAIVPYRATALTAEEQEWDANLSVEARYSSNHLRWDTKDGATEYIVMKADSLSGAYKTLTTVETNDYIDTEAGTGTQCGYKVAAVTEAAVSVSAAKDAGMETGVKAVQDNAQMHYDFKTTEKGRVFDGTRIEEVPGESVDKVKALEHGTFLIAVKDGGWSSRQCLMTLKDRAQTTPDSGDTNHGAVLWRTSATGTRLNIYGTGLKENYTFPENKWTTWAMSSAGKTHKFFRTISGATFGNNFTDTWGFLYNTQNVDSMTIGAAKNGEQTVQNYIGEIAYVTITDEAMEQAELNAYSQAVKDSLDYKMEVSDYKTGAEASTWNAPTEDGKVFAGWYTDDTYTTPYTQTSGKAYAKFVDADVMNVKAQIEAKDYQTAESTTMRFVSTIAVNTNYQSVGFKICYSNGTDKVVDGVQHTVYKSLYAVGTSSGEPMTITPDKANGFSEESDYFFAYNITNIPRSAFDTEFTVTPYWVTMDGTKVSGTAVTKTVNQGIAVLNAR